MKKDKGQEGEDQYEGEGHRLIKGIKEVKKESTIDVLSLKMPTK